MRRMGIIFILVLVATCIPVACTKPAVTPAPTTEPESAQNVNSYSNWDFSFEYPKEFVLSEMGLFENEANDNSGLIMISHETADEFDFYAITWWKIVKSAYEGSGGMEICQNQIEGFLTEDPTSALTNIPGEIVKETKSGHDVIYQYYTVSDLNTGEEADAIAASFYCDYNEYIYGIDSFSTQSDTEEEALGFFKVLFDSFKCH